MLRACLKLKLMEKKVDLFLKFANEWDEIFSLMHILFLRRKIYIYIKKNEPGKDCLKKRTK